MALVRNFKKRPCSIYIALLHYIYGLSTFFLWFHFYYQYLSFSLTSRFSLHSRQTNSSFARCRGMEKRSEPKDTVEQHLVWLYVCDVNSCHVCCVCAQKNVQQMEERKKYGHSNQ